MYTIYTTFKNKPQATKIAKILLEEKLAGCINIFPIYSIYKINNKTVSEGEVGAFIKTPTQKVTLLEKMLEKIHPYDIPIIETIAPEKINSKYLIWLSEEVK